MGRITNCSVFYPESRKALVSVRKIYGKLILSGEKTAELRRIRPNLHSDDILFIYVSSPVKELCGYGKVDKVISGTPTELWKCIGERSCVNDKTFFSYFSGCDIGHAILLAKIFPFNEPISLDKLRKVWSGFHPPQGHHYLTENQVNLLRIKFGVL